MLKPKLTKLTTVSRTIIAHNHDNAVVMRKDLQNGPLHVFGKHDDCKPYYCKFTDTTTDSVDKSENNVDDMKQNAPTVWALICAANEMVMSKANRLSNETTNYVENFMSMISKFNCGKRLNLHKRGSYQRRVHIAGNIFFFNYCIDRIPPERLVHFPDWSTFPICPLSRLVHFPDWSTFSVGLLSPLVHLTISPLFRSVHLFKRFTFNIDLLVQSV